MVFWQKFAHKSVIFQQNFAHKNVILSWKFPHKNVIAIKKVLWPRKTFSENPQKTARFRIKYAPKSVLFFCQGPYQKVANFCIKKLPISVSEKRQLLYSHLSLEKCHFFYSNCHDFITKINENCIDFITKYRKLSYSSGKNPQ